MKFGKSILKPGYCREQSFTSYDPPDKSFRFCCVNCKLDIGFKYVLLIDAQWNWEDNFAEQNISEIKRFYDMNAVGKSPDGRWTAVTRFSCRNCNTTYLAYGGVNEAPNSFYTVVLQGITEILEG